MLVGRGRQRGSLILLVMSGVAACTSMTKVDPPPTSTTHVLQKNFAVGELKSVAVGETMVSLKDYYEKTKQNTWSIGQPVKLRVGLGSMVLIPGEYAVTGRVKVDGTTCDVVDAKVHPYELTTLSPSSAAVPMTFLVDESGRIARAGGGLGITNEVSGLEPADFRATRGQKTDIDSRRSFTNFELLYSGAASGTVKLTYREYAPNDLRHPASFQDLTYNLADKSIRFKNVLIDIESADNQTIRFRVKSVPQEWLSAGQ
jgi:hypothetical protein